MDIKELAKQCGFTVAENLDPKTLEFLPDVRSMCAADRCRSYNRSWACPPACGSLEEFTEKAARYQKGVLLQTVGDREDSYDFEAMMEVQADNHRHFQALADSLVAAGAEGVMLNHVVLHICDNFFFV